MSTEESFLIPLKYIDVIRPTHTDLDKAAGRTRLMLYEHTSYDASQQVEMCNVPEIENAIRSGTGNVACGMNGTQE